MAEVPEVAERRLLPSRAPLFLDSRRGVEKPARRPLAADQRLPERPEEKVRRHGVVADEAR